MQTAGIHHVNVVVDDLDVATRFYGEVLGLASITRADSANAGRWFSLGSGQELHLGCEPGHRGPERQHFALVVADLDDTVRALAERGVDVEGPVELSTGARQAFLRDPSDNLLELHERAVPD